MSVYGAPMRDIRGSHGTLIQITNLNSYSVNHVPPNEMSVQRLWRIGSCIIKNCLEIVLYV